MPTPALRPLQPTPASKPGCAIQPCPAAAAGNQRRLDQHLQRVPRQGLQPEAWKPGVCAADARSCGQGAAGQALAPPASCAPTRPQWLPEIACTQPDTCP